MNGYSKPTDEHTAKIRENLVKMFFGALEKDMYPYVEIEKVFGIIMLEQNTYGDDITKIPIGTLVFYVWNVVISPFLFHF
jgi:hypothetical protein